MSFKHLTYFFFATVLFSFSCTPYKNVPYFQDLKSNGVETEKITNFSPILLQPGDLLGFHVTSLDHNADATFNYNLVRPNGNINANNGIDVVEQNAVFGYLVDTDGNISLPTIGLVKVAGLTTKDCALLLNDKLSKLLREPHVTIRLANFKISVLGDVKIPGSVTVLNERITIPEALSLAGDLNTTGIRTNVLLVREIDGTRTFVHIDLTSKNLFKSPYYYLKNNDVLYITPNKEKVNNDGTSFQKVSVVLTIISILAIILSKHI